MTDLRSQLGRIVRKLPRGRLAQGTVLALGWQVCRMAALAVWVVIAARTFGVDGYGVFAGIAGLATAAAGFSGLGTGYLLCRHVAMAPDQFSAYWKKALLAYSGSGLVMALCLVAVACTMFPQTRAEFAWLIALSEVAAYPFVSASAYAFAAHERIGWSAALPALGGALRLVALLAYLALGAGDGLGSYLWFHLASSMLAAMLSVLAVRMVLRPRRVSTGLSWSDLRESLPFSAVWFTGIAMTSWDKALTLRLGGAEASGLYAAAYRFASLVALPMDSLVMAMSPRMFRHGGLGGSDQGLMRYSLIAILGFGVIAAAMVWWMAPLLPWMLGAQFGSSVDVVRGIGLMIPFYGLRQLGGHVLVTYGRRGARIAIDAFALALMTSLALWLIPSRGVMGAVTVIVCTEAFLAMVTWSLALPTLRRAASRDVAVSPQS
ncbi:lipopolysaccharide biosynthesis protein [Lysobacter sp. LF1]|uniref:Lipopolysaccharide biosynthesis protein n=1 Tax=Lysobacter stagni TaxID=3045172 RepID=A0ABT6XFB3_9GAMM|nr:lipopolysaccharide biosynthesis protein [Lysobacter sp. LF1]MDI9238830.1 lipopolysaccharide biosynthesis protein [Lysobacter sp. LF1]